MEFTGCPPSPNPVFCTPAEHQHNLDTSAAAHKDSMQTQSKDLPVSHTWWGSRKDYLPQTGLLLYDCVSLFFSDCVWALAFGVLVHTAICFLYWPSCAGLITIFTALPRRLAFLHSKQMKWKKQTCKKGFSLQVVIIYIKILPRENKLWWLILIWKKYIYFVSHFMSVSLKSVGPWGLYLVS